MPEVKVPKSIEFEIRRDQVFENVYQLMEDMSRIRFECINSGRIEEDKALEYLKLANFLSKSVLSVTSATANQRLGSLVSSMNHNPALVYFDTLQRRYWEKHEPDFLANLDSVLIQIYGERFDSLDKGHHLVSAVKCVCAQNEETDSEKTRILGSVLPVTGIVRGIDLQTLICEGVLNRGQDSADLKDQLSLKIGSLEDVIENLVQYAREVGVLSIEIPVTRTQYDELVKKFPDAMPVGSKKISGNNVVKTRFIVNKAPVETASKQVHVKLEKFLQDKTLVDLFENYTPLNPGLFLDSTKVLNLGRYIHDKVSYKLRKVNCLEEIKCLSLGELEIKLASIVREFVQYPETYGLLIGDKVKINELVTHDEANDESIWKGSYGEITGISRSYTVEFHDPKIKGQKKEKEKTQKKGTDVVVWEIERRHLEKVSDKKTSFPSWYKRGDIEIGDIVKINDKYADDEEIETGDLNSGSVGRVVGLTYEVHFDKVYHRDGKDRTRTDVSESDINQVYLTRTKTMDPSEIEKLIHDEIAIQIKEALKGSDPEIKFETVDIGESKGFSYHEEVESYDKAVLFFRKGKNYCVLTYVTEKNTKKKSSITQDILRKLGLIKRSDSHEIEITDDKIMAHIAGYKGLIRDAYETISRALNPIHITLAEVRDGKRVNYFTGTR